MMKNIHAIILAGCIDFGRCEIASRLPVSLWPVIDKPAINKLLEDLCRQGMTCATICFDGDPAFVKRAVGSLEGVTIDYLQETLPYGTGGCLREVMKRQTDCSDQYYLVCKAGVTSAPDVAEILQIYEREEHALTVVLNPDSVIDNKPSETAGLYLCGLDVLEYLPKAGFVDIKEKLIPDLVKAGRKIGAGRLTKAVGNFREWISYLKALALFMNNSMELDNDDKVSQISPGIWCGKNVKVAETAKILGPTVILDNAVIEDGAVIFGPTVIGRGSVVNRNSCIENCVIWDNSIIGENCHLSYCLVDNNTNIRNNTETGHEVVVK